MSKKQKIIKIGEVEFRVLFGGLLPPKKDDEFERLKASIKEVGMLVPVLTDENRGIIDGEHRLQAASELNLKSVPSHILPGLDENEKKHLAIRLNAQRRQMTQEERLALATDLRKDGLSLRQIAEILNVSHVTVSRILGTVTDVTVEFPDKVTGKDGKQRPAKVVRKPKTCITTKNIGEAKRAFDAFDKIAGIDSTDLPKSSMDVKRLERVAREKTNEHLRSQNYNDFNAGKAELLLGDFRVRGGKEIADDSVDIIFTDPPYSKDMLPIWNDLGEFAARVLKPGGLLLSYSGCLYLPEIHNMLGNSLTYHWTAAIYHSGGKKLVRAARVHQAWKPVLIYYKPPLSKYWNPFVDMVSGGQAKSNHAREQSVYEASHFIQALCPKDGVLLDPMMGSATTIVAGLNANLGLTCIGCEIDKAAYAVAEQRVKDTIEQLQARKDSA